MSCLTSNKTVGSGGMPINYINYECEYKGLRELVVKLESQLKCYEEQLKNKDTTIEELKSVIKILSKQLK